jgi:hypothetical protein
MKLNQKYTLEILTSRISNSAIFNLLPGGFCQILSCCLVATTLVGCSYVQVDPEYDSLRSQIRKDCRGDEIVGVWVTQTYLSTNDLTTESRMRPFVLKIDKDGTYNCWFNTAAGAFDGYFIIPPLVTTFFPPGNNWKYEGNGVWRFSFDYMSGTSSIYLSGGKLLWWHSADQNFVFVRADDDEAVKAKMN